jgi:hypothetical protein
MDRFTSNYTKFYKSVKTITPELFTKFSPALPEDDLKKLDFFVTNWYPHMKETSNGNLKYFEDSGTNPLIFQNLKFLDIMNSVSNTNKNVVWEYLHSLYALSISSKQLKERFTEEGVDNCELYKYIQNTIDDFPELISNMVSWRREKKEQEEKNNKNKKSKIPSFDEKFIEGSALAKLAKEISDEINPDEILKMGDDMKNMDNPMKMFQSLLSGDQDNGVGKLMSTVCDKLKNKMESGEINQEELLKEATTLLQSMGGLGASSKGDGPDLAGMMSMAQNLASMGDLFGGAEGGGGKGKSRKFKRKMDRKIRKKNKGKPEQKNDKST